MSDASGVARHALCSCRHGGLAGAVFCHPPFRQGVGKAVVMLALLALQLQTTAAARRLISGGTPPGHQTVIISPPQEGPESDPLGVTLLEYEGWADGTQHRPCVEYFARRTQAESCEAIPAPSNWQGPPVAAEMCNMPGGDVMVSILTALHLSAVFHAHLVGPQVAVLPVSTCAIAMRNEGNTAATPQPSGSGHASAALNGAHATSSGHSQRAAAAHQLLITDMLPGDYQLTVRMVYQNFSYSMERSHTADSACGEPLWRLPISIKPAPGSQACTYCDPHREAWPVCNTSFVRGTVLMDQAAQASSSSSQHAVPLETGLSRDAWQGVLHYQPKGCNFVPKEKIDLQKCFSKRLVCFVGDSHSRHAQNGLIDALQDQGVTAVDGTPDHIKYRHDSVQFVWEQWGDLDAVEASRQLEGCTDIIFGVGAWVLSNKAPRWTAGHYAFMLNKAFKAAQRMRAQQGRRVHFITMPHHRYTCVNVQESRTPPFIALFNRLAVTLAQWYQVPVINTVDLTGPLYETAHDHVHHHYIGVVGSAITQYILNVLCVQPQAS